MQPIAEVTFTRPWHWGIAIVGDPAAGVPTELDGVVAVGRDVVTVSVRHAQDVEAERFEGDWSWATATFHVRSLAQEEAIDRLVLCDVQIATPGQSLALGDADVTVHLPTPGLRTRVVVSADEVDPTGLEHVWIDLLGADDARRG